MLSEFQFHEGQTSCFLFHLLIAILSLQIFCPYSPIPPTRIWAPAAFSLLRIACHLAITRVTASLSGSLAWAIWQSGCFPKGIAEKVAFAMLSQMDEVWVLFKHSVLGLCDLVLLCVILRVFFLVNFLSSQVFFISFSVYLQAELQEFSLHTDGLSFSVF